MGESPDSEIQSKRFGQAVRDLRKKAGFSQEGFADHCGLHRTTMSLIERGNHSVTLQTIYKIADGLGIQVSDLFTKIEEGSPLD